MTITVPESIQKRRKYTDDRLAAFTDALNEALNADTEYALGHHACLYVTGSGGRGEMHEHSDLDTFIVYRDPSGADLENPRLRSMLLQAAVVRASRALDLPDPSRDGEFLAPHRAKDLIVLLGSPADDMQNKLTARMLLLLESRVLLGDAVHEQVIHDVMQRYWETSQGHEDDFLPYMLANDIIRFWRIILLNHEAKLSRKKAQLETNGHAEDEVEREMKYHRKYSSYKMRFARCLTCFSALALMLARTKAQPNLILEDAVEMVRQTPLERLESVASVCPETEPQVQQLLDRYGEYLDQTEAREADITEQLRNDPEFGKTLSRESTAFPTEMLELLLSLRDGPNEPLFRHMVI